MDLESEVPNEVPHSPGPGEGDQPEAVPRGVRAMALLRWILIVAAGSLAAFSWWTIARADPNALSAPRYYCPMHPQITSHDPGECPICHMTLEPIPEARKKKPASPAPLPAANSAAPVSSGAPGNKANTPPGTAPVTLTLDRVQAIGVRTTIAREEKAEGSLRAPATIEAPETGAAEVHSRTSGFVERVAVKEPGGKVRAGQELIAIYSPEAYQAQSEFLAVRGFAGTPGSAETEAVARKKLSLLGLSDAAIAHLIEKREPERTVSLSAPLSGYVTKKNVVLGSFVTPETALYEIVDLSKVYVIANLYASEASRVPSGTQAKFIPAEHPEPHFAAKVDLIYPAVNAEAQTTRVRLQVGSGDTMLMPGAYGTVEFDAPGATLVSVPRDALIDTGLSTYVFVDEGGGHFTPRVVVLGPELDGDRLQIRAGLAAGERVVSGATFLIDSESRLRAAVAPAGEP